MNIGKSVVFISFLAIVFLFNACGNRQGIKKVKVNLKVKELYCGGAAPTEEILKAMEEYRPVEGQFYIHKNSNREDEALLLKTDIDGNGTVLGLSPGTYFLYRTSKEDFLAVSNPQTEEEICLHNKSMMFLTKFEITSSKTKKIEINGVIPCDPCGMLRP